MITELYDTGTEQDELIQTHATRQIPCKMGSQQMGVSRKTQEIPIIINYIGVESTPIDKPISETFFLPMTLKSKQLLNKTFIHLNELKNQSKLKNEIVSFEKQINTGLLNIQDRDIILEQINNQLNVLVQNQNSQMECSIMLQSPRFGQDNEKITQTMTYQSGQIVSQMNTVVGNGIVQEIKKFSISSSQAINQIDTHLQIGDSKMDTSRIMQGQDDNEVIIALLPPEYDLIDEQVLNDKNLENFIIKFMENHLKCQKNSIQILGKGSFGYVFKAFNENNKKRAFKFQLKRGQFIQEGEEFKTAHVLNEEGNGMLYGEQLKYYKQIFFMSNNPHTYNILMIEMELADSSLQNMLDNNEEITEEQFSNICRQLIKNLMTMHNMLLVHYDIKPENVLLTKATNRFMFADFGISEQLEVQSMDLISQNEVLMQMSFGSTDKQSNEVLYDTFQRRDCIKGTPLFFSPQVRKIYNSNNRNCLFMHDPFKSDIYSLGLCLLYVFLKTRKKLQTREINLMFQNPALVETQSKQINLNNYIFQSDKLVYIDKGDIFEAQIPNILNLMLKENEIDRISSLQLTLITNAQELLIDSKIKDPFGNVFQPLVKDQDKNSATLIYKLRKLKYTGGVMKNGNNIFVKHGMGVIIKDGKLIFDGNFEDDVPHGYINVMVLFQDLFYYKGWCQHGYLHGEGMIYYKNDPDLIVFQGLFKNNMLVKQLKNNRNITKCNIRIFNQQVLMFRQNCQKITGNPLFFLKLLQSMNGAHLQFLEGLQADFRDDEDTYIVMNIRNFEFKFSVSLFRQQDYFRGSLFLYFLRTLWLEQNIQIVFTVIIRNKKYINIEKLLETIAMSPNVTIYYQISIDKYEDLMILFDKKSIINALSFFKLYFNFSLSNNIIFPVTLERDQNQLKIYDAKVIKSKIFQMIGVKEHQFLIQQLSCNDQDQKNQIKLTKLHLNQSANMQIMKMPQIRINYLIDFKKDYFLNYLSRTKKISLNDLQFFNNQDFKKFLGMLFSLESITIQNCYKIDKQGYQYFLDRIRNISTLIEIAFINPNLKKNQINFFQFFLGSQKLKNIIIQNTRAINQNDFKIFEKIHVVYQLQKIDLAHCVEINHNHYQLLRLFHCSPVFQFLEEVILDGQNVVFPNDSMFRLNLKNCFKILQLNEIIDPILNDFQEYMQIVYSKNQMIKIISDDLGLYKITKNYESAMSDLDELLIDIDLQSTRFSINLHKFNNDSKKQCMKKDFQIQIYQDLEKMFSISGFKFIKQLDLSMFSITTKLLQDFCDSNYNNNIQYINISNAFLQEQDFDILCKLKLRTWKELKAFNICDPKSNKKVTISDIQVYLIIKNNHALGKIYLDRSTELDKAIRTLNLTQVQQKLELDDVNNQIHSKKRKHPFFTDCTFIISEVNIWQTDYIINLGPKNVILSYKSDQILSFSIIQNQIQSFKKIFGINLMFSQFQPDYLKNFIQQDLSQLQQLIIDINDMEFQFYDILLDLINNLKNLNEIKTERINLKFGFFDLSKVTILYDQEGLPIIPKLQNLNDYFCSQIKIIDLSNLYLLNGYEEYDIFLNMSDKFKNVIQIKMLNIHTGKQSSIINKQGLQKQRRFSSLSFFSLEDLEEKTKQKFSKLQKIIFKRNLMPFTKINDGQALQLYANKKQVEQEFTVNNILKLPQDIKIDIKEMQDAPKLNNSCNLRIFISFLDSEQILNLEIDFTKNNMNFNDIKNVSDALKGMIHLQKLILHLEGNKCQKKGAIYLSLALFNFKRLKNNQIGNEGFAWICESLKNKPIQKMQFNLSKNKLSKINHLCYCLSSLQNLTNLGIELQINQLDKQQVQQILDTIPGLPKPDKLVLKLNLTFNRNLTLEEEIFFQKEFNQMKDKFKSFNVQVITNLIKI